MTGKTLKNFALMSASRSAAVTSVVLSLTLATGCANESSPSLSPPATLTLRHYIAHVVVIVQENRSFDNLFSGFPGAEAPRFGYDGRKRIALHPTLLEDPGNIENNWRDAIGSWNNGKMDGFAGEHFYGGPARLRVCRRAACRVGALLGDGQAVRSRRPHVSNGVRPQLYGAPEFDRGKYHDWAGARSRRLMLPRSFHGDATRRRAPGPSRSTSARIERFNGPVPMLLEAGDDRRPAQWRRAIVELLCRAVEQDRGPSLVGVRFDPSHPIQQLLEERKIAADSDSARR